MQPPSSKPTTTNKLPRNAIAHPSQLERRGLMGSSNRPEYQIAEVSPILPDFRPRSTPLSEKLWQEYRSRRLGHVKSPGFFQVEGAISATGRTLRQPRAGPLTTHLPVLADKAGPAADLRNCHEGLRFPANFRRTRQLSSGCSPTSKKTQKTDGVSNESDEHGQDRNTSRRGGAGSLLRPDRDFGGGCRAPLPERIQKSGLRAGDLAAR